MLLRSTCARDGCMRAYVVCMRMLRVYVGACVSGCASIQVFAHNGIAWMCNFQSCMCMYVCTTHMRVACARACMRCACSQKRNCECQNVQLPVHECVCVCTYACACVCVCAHTHACMYMRRVCAHRKKIDLMYTFHCLYMNVCAHTHVRAYACVLVCACVYVHASCACSQKED